MEESDNKKNSNNEHSPPSSNSSNLNPKSKVVSHECKICGAPALHSNYGAMTCYPCKMFFKRNVALEQVSSNHFIFIFLDILNLIETIYL